MSIFSLNDGINLLMKEYYTGNLLLKTKAIGMIIVGILLLLTIILLPQLLIVFKDSTNVLFSIVLGAKWLI